MCLMPEAVTCVTSIGVLCVVTMRSLLFSVVRFRPHTRVTARVRLCRFRCWVTRPCPSLAAIFRCASPTCQCAICPLPDLVSQCLSPRAGDDFIRSCSRTVSLLSLRIISVRFCPESNLCHHIYGLALHICAECHDSKACRAFQVFCILEKYLPSSYQVCQGMCSGDSL